MTTGQKLPGMPVVGAVCVSLSQTGSVGWLPSCSASCAVCWSVPLERKRTVGLDVMCSHQELSYSYPELRQSLLVPAPQSHCDPLRCPRAFGPSQELEGANPLTPLEESAPMQGPHTLCCERHQPSRSTHHRPGICRLKFKLRQKRLQNQHPTLFPALAKASLLGMLLLP